MTVRVVFDASERPPLDKTVKVMLIVWCALLPLWAMFAAVSGMAFDSGPTLSAYVAFFWLVFAYPILLGIAFFCRRKKRWIVWLPSLVFVLPFADFVMENVIGLFR